MSTSRPKRSASSPPPISSSSSKVVTVKKVKVEPSKNLATSDSIPLELLKRTVKAFKASVKPKLTSEEEKEGCIVFWMRNKDFRITDNTALSAASKKAQELSLPLLVLHVFSPSDYKSHDRSPRRIDFQIRQLKVLRIQLAAVQIPLYTVTLLDRKLIPSQLVALLGEWKTRALYGNIEYEVDELRRDVEVLKLVIANRKKGESWRGEVEFLEDLCVVPPGKVLSLSGTPYSVYSPWYKNWSALIAKTPKLYLSDAGTPVANPATVRDHAVLGKMFAQEIPDEIEGFGLEKEDSDMMKHLWPVGDDITDQILHRFLKTKIRMQAFQHPPLHPGSEDVGPKQSKIGVYGDGRNRVDQDGTSHISAYLSAGIITSRQCLRASMELTGGKLQTDKSDGGIGVWVSEIAWKDFYVHVLAAWPRVCMGKPFNLKFDNIVWEESEEKLQAWKDGKTGFPIVDAAMRALKVQGYMHNRCRMIVAMFLTKDLLLDWRLGEKHFMEQLIDGDLSSNNGGWQWSASTGTDPQPYFRVFNPTTQSEKSDPTGEYIKFWVPELKKLKGKSLHEPHSTFGKKELERMGYYSPIVDHAKARIRAIARYKNPGSADNE